MSKFDSTIGANSLDGVRQARVNQAKEAIQTAFEQSCIDFKVRIQTLKQKISQHQDLGPDESTSLRIVANDFNPKTWVDKLMQMESELLLLETEYTKVYLRVKDEWFPAETIIPVLPTDGQ